MPIYQKKNGAFAPITSTSSLSEEERLHRLGGWAAVVFRASDILRPLSNFMPPDVMLRIYDGSVGPE